MDCSTCLEEPVHDSASSGQEHAEPPPLVGPDVAFGAFEQHLARRQPVALDLGRSGFSCDGSEGRGR